MTNSRGRGALDEESNWTFISQQIWILSKACFPMRLIQSVYHNKIEHGQHECNWQGDN